MPGGEENGQAVEESERVPDFWSDTLGCPRHIVAPMVDQSELPWRLLSRRYGAQLVYTPMINAGVFLRDAARRKESLATCPEDRPLIVQFCANTVENFVEAARYVQHMCDAVDLNLGCPQQIAKRGHYGAFLQDEWDLLQRMVSTASKEISVPITCKIRVFPSVEKTVKYAKMLESAGCKLLTVHGRTREQKGHKTGLANWEHIKAVKDNLKIPVVSNGNIRYLSDIDQCLAETGVDGVMVAEGNLTNPALFTGKMPPVWVLADEYLELARQYPPETSAVRAHLFRLWHKCLPLHQDLRAKLASASGFEPLVSISHTLGERMRTSCGGEVEVMADQETEGGDVEPWRCQPYVRPPLPANNGSEGASDGKDNPDGAAEAKPKKVKRPANKRKGGNPKESREVRKAMAFEKKYRHCTECTSNPSGLKCENNRCRACCKVFSARNILDCNAHNLKFKTRKEQQADLPRSGVENEDDDGPSAQTADDSVDTPMDSVS